MKTVLIDFNGTICFDYFWRSAKDGECALIDEFLFKQNPQIIDDWMRGKYTDDFINQLLSENLDLDYEYLWNIFVSDCKTMYIDSKLISLIQRLRETRKVFLVTDNMDCFDRFTIPSLGLENLFDGIYNSYNYKTMKSSRLFNIVREKENIDFSETILIDDSKSVKPIFEKLGGEVFTVTSIEDTIKVLLSL